MVTNYKKVGKIISYLLRHNPEDLVMDALGFVFVKDLLLKLQIDKTDLDYIVVTDDKKRFSYNHNMSKIRANQGHNKKLDVNINFKVLDKTNVPDKLYHGTANHNINSILKRGLIPGDRQYVHLSKDVETATNVGLRHSKNMSVLIIDSKKMVENGLKIVISDNDVYLTQFVDPKYIMI